MVNFCSKTWWWGIKRTSLSVKYNYVMSSRQTAQFKEPEWNGHFSSIWKKSVKIWWIRLFVNVHTEMTEKTVKSGCWFILFKQSNVKLFWGVGGAAVRWTLMSSWKLRREDTHALHCWLSHSTSAIGPACIVRLFLSSSVFVLIPSLSPLCLSVSSISFYKGIKYFSQLLSTPVSAVSTQSDSL